MVLLNILIAVNLLVGAAFVLCYSHQIFYIVFAFIKKPYRYRDTEKRHRYAFMISARNEDDVIGELCDSIRAQNYPRELIDIYVVADNCTDSTARVAREKGAVVYERNDLDKVGKGYALEYLFESVRRDGGWDRYEGYFVIDADNLLHPDFTLEMNKAVDEGRRIIVSYRNSKNYGENWISAGNSLWFLRASRHLNCPRHLLGVSCEVQGTGFFVHRDIIERQGGWIHHLLIEDIEFTVDNVLQGEKVAYCHDAVIYDEQVSGFKQSWWQRKRWTRGYFQVLRRYGWRLLKGFLGGKGFSNFDMLMAITPAVMLSIISMSANLLLLVLSIFISPESVPIILAGIGLTILCVYLFFFAVGAVSAISERKKVDVSAGKKVLYMFTFPLFMYTYLPIVVSALVAHRVEWKQIKHHAKNS